MTDDRLIWLALVGHADRLGVVTRCPISTLADYARIRPSQARATIDRLASERHLSILTTSGKRAHYRLLNDWRADREAARHFLESEGERVRSLQNHRSRLYQAAKSDHALGPDIRLLDLERTTHKEGLMRFTLRINGVGLIRNCAVLRRRDGTHYFGEPAKRLGSSWEKTCDVDPTIASEAIDAALRPRAEAPLRWMPAPDFHLEDIVDVPVDGMACRWRTRFTLVVPSIIVIRDCAVMEQLDGTHIAVGPGKNDSGKWSRMISLDAALADRIIAKLLAMRQPA